MLRHKMVLLAWLLGASWAWAEGFVTDGDGTQYSLKVLSAIAASGVTETAEGQYELAQALTIAAGDRFVMDDGATVGFAQGVTLTIAGDADFDLTEGSRFQAAVAADQLAAAIRITSASAVTMRRCDFETVGLEMMAAGALHISHCNFIGHDGTTAAALYFITAGAAGTVEDCHFEACRKAAIGSAANASQPLTISRCTFVENSAANGNVPQLNLTAANPLVVDECTVTGHPAHTMVGGIGISNFMGYDADVTVSRCHVEDNRYGIGLVGPAARVRIEGNTLLNNKYETNPMNGGSGISLYDPYQLTAARVTGNHVEGSLWGVTVIGCKDVNLGRIDVPETDERYNAGGNVFKDNGNGGALYDLYNNSANTVYAQGNTWNVEEQTQEQIETVVFHRADNSTLGEVIYWPAAASTRVATPVDTPRGDGAWYDLQGRRIQKPARRGIYVSHGQKVVL